MTTTPLFRLTIGVYFVRFFFSSSGLLFSILLFLGTLRFIWEVFFLFFEGWEGSVRRMEASDDGNEPLPFCVSSKNKAVKKGAVSAVIDKLQPGRLAGGRVDNPPPPRPPSLHTHTHLCECQNYLAGPRCPFAESEKSSLGIRRYEDVL